VSGAVVFLAGALIACVVGLILLWITHSVSRRRRRRRAEISFADQMRALSTNPDGPRREQPVGIVTLDPIDKES